MIVLEALCLYDFCKILLFNANISAAEKKYCS